MPTATNAKKTGSQVAPAPEAPARRTRTGAGMEVYGLLLTAFSILLLLSLVSFDARDIALDYKLRGGRVHNLIGPVGAHIADLLLRCIGVGAVFTCTTFFYFGGLLLAGRRPSITGGGLGAWLLTLVFGSVLCHLALSGLRPFAHSPGGLTGEWVGEILRALFATTGTVIIAVSVLGAAALRLSGLTMRQVARLPARIARLSADWLDGRRQSRGRSIFERLSRRRRPRGDRPDWLEEDGHNDVTGSRRPATRPEKRRRDEAAEDRVAERQAPPVERREPERREPEPEPRQPEPRRPEPRQPEPAPPTQAPPPRTAPIVEEPAPRPAPAPAPRDPVPEPQPRPVIERGSKEDAVSADAEPVRLTPEDGGPVIEERVQPGPLPIVAGQDALPFEGPNRVYEFPSLTLLDYEPPPRGSVDRDALNEAAATLEAKLADFGVKGKVVKIMPGPVVTMFEFLPAAGVKISKIANLSDDLTMALHAQRVRIVAPIPGKGVVGIEVPSAVRETVYLKEILASDEFQDSRAKLPISLGKDIVGNALVTDLARAPHLLVAGSTGSGKSVAVNAFIMSMAYRLKPTDLRLILVDPKMLELSVYDDIPHLLLPVVTEPKKASLALKWAVSEMERRYRLLAACGVRNISGFNAKLEKYRSGQRAAPDSVAEDELEHLPYIVIILDELADLMMVSGKEVEQSIARLAQMARAAGIHLVVATQRPSVDVITGLIKANFPTRMSFMVSQKVDSRTILDRMGAENLLGQGDMLFMPPGTSKLVRVQGCFVSDEEVERVVEHLKQYGPPDYDMDILIDDEEQGKDLSKEDYDPLFDEAVAIVTETNNPSISYLQRRLKIGYNRSARIVERMEYDGIISRPDHRGVRKVLAPAAPEDV